MKSIKSLGQHFLKNPAVIRKIITELDIKEGEMVIEIGPGHGELTRSLAEACEKIGATVVAVEKDEKLAAALKIKNVEAVNDDALTFLMKVQNHNFKLVGNIPYYITGHLLRVVSEMEIKPKRTIFMIQKEVAERICAAPPKMNRLAASVQFWAEAEIIARVPKTDFTPPPEVDSAVIKLDTREFLPKNPDKYYATIRTLFAQPRKTIINNLTQLPKKEMMALLVSLGVNPADRPQNLTIENICAIADACA